MLYKKQRVVEFVVQLVVQIAVMELGRLLRSIRLTTIDGSGQRLLGAVRYIEARVGVWRTA